MVADGGVFLVSETGREYEAVFKLGPISCGETVIRKNDFHACRQYNSPQLLFEKDWIISIMSWDWEPPLYTSKLTPGATFDVRWTTEWHSTWKNPLQVRCFRKRGYPMSVLPQCQTFACEHVSKCFDERTRLFKPIANTIFTVWQTTEWIATSPL